VYELEILASRLRMSLEQKLSWVGSKNGTCEGNDNYDQDPELIQRLKGELKKFSLLMDIFLRVMEKKV